MVICKQNVNTLEHFFSVTTQFLHIDKSHANKGFRLTSSGGINQQIVASASFFI